MVGAFLILRTSKPQGEYGKTQKALIDNSRWSYAKTKIVN
jgi:hypothetical protein